MSERSELLHTITQMSGVIHRLMHTRMHGLLQQVGMPLSQVMLLQSIHHQQPINARQLADQLQLTRGAVSQTLDALLQAGLIIRSTDTIDRRLTNLYVSPAGAAKVKQIETLRAGALTKALSNLTDTELATYVAIQHKIVDHFRTTENTNTSTKESSHA